MDLRPRRAALGKLRTPLTSLKQTALDNKRLLADPTPKTPLPRFDFSAILGLSLET
jgi:hypothetical protein